MRDLEPARYISPALSQLTNCLVRLTPHPLETTFQHEGAVLSVHNVHCGRAATLSLQSPGHPHTLLSCSHCSPWSPGQWSPSPPKHVHIVHRGQLGTAPHSPETSSPWYKDLQACRSCSVHQTAAPQISRVCPSAAELTAA